MTVGRSHPTEAAPHAGRLSLAGVLGGNAFSIVLPPRPRDSATLATVATHGRPGPALPRPGSSLLLLLQSLLLLQLERIRCMDEQEIAAAIGWMMVAGGVLAVMLASVFSSHGFRATSAGLLLGLLGLLITGHIMGGGCRVCADGRPLRLLPLSPLQGLTLGPRAA